MVSSNGNNVDVVVIGGGPAGSTASTLLAQQGYRVKLYERDRFPRFHIGESLIPRPTGCSSASRCWTR
jgi:flavin-dependent dehydrogenase